MVITQEGTGQARAAGGSGEKQPLVGNGVCSQQCGGGGRGKVQCSAGPVPGARQLHHALWQGGVPAQVGKRWQVQVAGQGTGMAGGVHTPGSILQVWLHTTNPHGKVAVGTVPQEEGPAKKGMVAEPVMGKCAGTIGAKAIQRGCSRRQNAELLGST